MRKLFTLLAVGLLFALGLGAPEVQAGIVTTDSFLEQQAAEQRDEIVTELQRDDVRTQLAEMGVEPEMIEQRVAALSDEEIRALATEMDELPAGAAIDNTTLLLLIILLILLL